MQQTPLLLLKGLLVHRDELHSEQGPFHWAFEMLMSLGRRALRMGAATALCLCKRLVDSPWAAPYYADELYSLLLFDPKTDNLLDHVVSGWHLNAEVRCMH